MPQNADRDFVIITSDIVLIRVKELLWFGSKVKINNHNGNEAMHNWHPLNREPES